MFTGWMKHFEDGSLIKGLSDQVSWRKTRLEEMVSCQYWYKDKIVLDVMGKGNYWFSEDYEVEFGSSHPKLVTARIQKLIVPGQDNFISEIINLDSRSYFNFLKEGYNSPHIFSISEHYNEWYTMEYHIGSGLIDSFSTYNRI